MGSTHSSRFVVIMPPSPQVVMFLRLWKLKTPTSPMEPALRPLYSAFGACAQSSSTKSLCFFARAMIGSMSHMSPP